MEDKSGEYPKKKVDDNERAARQRRIYLRIRIEELKAELVRLNAERKSLAVASAKPV